MTNFLTILRMENETTLSRFWEIVIGNPNMPIRKILRKNARINPTEVSVSDSTRDPRRVCLFDRDSFCVCEVDRNDSFDNFFGLPDVK